MQQALLGRRVGKSINWSNAFMFTIDTTISGGTASDEFRLPIGNGFYDPTPKPMNVDWGDGSISENIVTAETHTYISPGVYTIMITDCNGFFTTSTNRSNHHIDRNKIINIDKFGNFLGTRSGLFAFCQNLTISAEDSPTLTTLHRAFYNCTNFNSNINHWDTSQVTVMYLTFNLCSNFNQPLNLWDTSNVANMQGMFAGCTNFNSSINDWDTSQVTNMRQMFSGCSSFNQDIGQWNVSSLQAMFRMFSGASSFNQDLSSWCVSSVTGAGYYTSGTSSWTLPKPNFNNPPC